MARMETQKREKTIRWLPSSILILRCFRDLTVTVQGLGRPRVGIDGLGRPMGNHDLARPRHPGNLFRRCGPNH